MITLDQIKQLDHKVRKAIDKINTLNSENNMLQEKLDNYQLRIEELEVLIDTFKEDQGEIENGIIDALNQLDILEDNIVISGTDSELAQESAELAQESAELAQESAELAQESAELAQESTEIVLESTDEQPNEDSDITEETTDETIESDYQKEPEDSNNEESESADSSENKESELDIF